MSGGGAWTTGTRGSIPAPPSFAPPRASAFPPAVRPATRAADRAWTAVMVVVLLAAVVTLAALVGLAMRSPVSEPGATVAPESLHLPPAVRVPSS